MSTMSWKAPAAALAAAVAAVLACDVPRERAGQAQWSLVDGGKPPCPSDAGTCVEVSAPTLPGACVDERWLAWISDPNATCPAVDGATGGSWEESKLFDESGAPATPKALRHYCLYEWSPTYSGGFPADTVRLKAVLDPQVSHLERDCYVAGPSGTSAGVDAGWRTLRQDFRRQTGRLAVLPKGGTPPARIRVAVVDSAPTGYTAGLPRDDRSGHGHAVGWIIRDHACPADGGTHCIGQIADHLALPQLTLKTRDPVLGGYFGSQGQVAAAIHGAVHGWRAFNLGGGSQPRLVVNLSLGWDPTHGGDVPLGSMPLPARAVYEAITHAVCQGALVIGAAGNDPGGPRVSTGPMLPAGWETRPAPTSTQCASAEGPAYSPGGQYPVFPQGDAGFYQPLIHAVSGVRADDRGLRNSRLGGRARLAAPAAHALGTDDGAPTDILTGTSAAAAVTSAIAAVVWGYRPTITAPEVMDIIRRSGEGLGEMADFCLGSKPCTRPAAERETMRVNLCAAVSEACRGGRENCPSMMLPCVSRGAYTGTLPSLTPGEMATITGSATRLYDASGVIYSLSPLSVCEHAQLWAAAPAYPRAPCPGRQFFGTPMRPWSGPQPSSDPCPVCTVEQMSASSWSVTLSIDEEFADESLSAPVLRVNDTYDIDLSGVGVLSGGDVAVVSGVDLSSVGTVESAEISFRMVDGGVPYSSASELILQP